MHSVENTVGVFGSPGLLRNSPPNRDFEGIQCLLDRLFPSAHWRGHTENASEPGRGAKLKSGFAAHPGWPNHAKHCSPRLAAPPDPHPGHHFPLTRPASPPPARIASTNPTSARRQPWPRAASSRHRPRPRASSCQPRRRVDSRRRLQPGPRGRRGLAPPPPATDSRRHHGHRAPSMTSRRLGLLIADHGLTPPRPPHRRPGRKLRQMRLGLNLRT
jgi:hypothetical protein